MRIKILTICLFCSTLFFSCKKEDLSDGTGPGNTYVPVLSKVLIDNKSAFEYLYNDSGMLWEVKGLYDFTLNNYNTDGQLISSKYYGNDDVLSSEASVSDKALAATTLLTLTTGKEGGTVTYEYNSGQLVKSITSRPSSTSSEYSVFAYDANNRINKQTLYWESVVTGYIDYTYDKKGNLAGESLYNMPSSGTAELITVTQYTYDSESNPYKATNKLQIPGINTNVNNILKETTTIHVSADQGADKTTTTENTYKYNSVGYPISQNDNITFVY